MNQVIHPYSNFSPFWGAGTTGPEVDAEFKFKSGESSGIHPRLAIDRTTDDGTADTGTAGDLSNPVFISDASKLEREQTSDLGHLVGAFAIGPVLTEIPRCWPDGTRHNQSIRVSAIQCCIL